MQNQPNGFVIVGSNGRRELRAALLEAVLPLYSKLGYHSPVHFLQHWLTTQNEQKMAA